MTRHFIAIVCMTFILFSGRRALANERYDAWQAKRPFIQAVGPNEFGGARFHLEEFKGSGLNTAMDLRWLGSQTWPVPESYDLPVIYLPYTFSGMEHFMTHWKEARAKHTNMIGILLGDELAGREAEISASVRKCRDWIVNNRDPEIASLITIDSEAAGDLVSEMKAIQDSWDRQVKATEPDVWLAQFYPVGGGELKRSYYSSLEWYFNWAKRHDVAMWCWLDTFSSSDTAIPCEVELRLQRFTSLAYGMRGFADFLWAADGSGPSVKGAGYWDGSGSPTQIYKDLSVINREIANIAQSLIRLTPVRAYHMDSRDDGDGVRHWSDSDADLPTYLRRTGKLVNVTGVANANHLLVGFFRDAAGEEYFMVVNKDFGKETTGEALATDVLLSFHPSVKSVQRLTRGDGKIETLPVENSQLSVRLPGGTGDLFRFDDSGGGFAGVEDVTLPKLASSQPATLPRIGRNVVELQFDRFAGNVTPLIRRSKDSVDLAETFTRQLSSDGKTLTLTENGTHLLDKTQYDIELKWADAKPVSVQVVRGDVDGDGKLTDGDANAIASPTDAYRADLNDDGKADEADAALLARIRNPLRFKWSQDFDSLAEGPVDGQGPWLKCDTLEGSLLSPSWVSAPVYISKAPSHVITGRKSLINEGRPGEYVGSEARFLDKDGMGIAGRLKVSFTMRVGTASYHNHCLHLFSATDVRNERGSIGMEITNGDVKMVSSYGVKLVGEATSAAFDTAGGSVRDFDIVMEINFGDSTLTWSFGDRQTRKKHGPFVTPYTGRLTDINAVDIVLRGERGAIDNLVIEGQ